MLTPFRVSIFSSSAGCFSPGRDHLRRLCKSLGVNGPRRPQVLLDGPVKDKLVLDGLERKLGGAILVLFPQVCGATDGPGIMPVG